MKKLAKSLEKVTKSLKNGGEIRPQQIEMAEIVDQAIKSKSMKFIEAGTGTGKSFAYLTPIFASEKKAIISTATIALQSQLMEQDIPQVITALGSSAKVALLKGRNNYICKQKLIELDDDQDQLKLATEQDKDLALKNVVEWANKTGTGDKEDLDVPVPGNVWQMVSTGASECPGAARCPSGDACFSEVARNNAFSADIIITNHHIYGLNLASEGELLPEHDIAIFDEAHQLPETLGMTCGLEIGPGAFYNLAKQFKSISTDQTHLDRIEKVAWSLEDALQPHIGEACELTTEMVASLVAARDICERTSKVFRKLRKDVFAELLAKVERASLYSDDLATRTDRFLQKSGNNVLWVDKAFSYPSLKLTPISVSEIVEKHLTVGKATIFTSATLPDQITSQLATSLTADVDRVGSPFNYAELGLLYCPTHLPAPNHATYRGETHKEMRTLINAAGGRSLLLFTSYSAMQEAYTYLESKVDYPILVQGHSSKSALLDEFKENPQACLAATMSFWQGVDIPGSTLNLVVIDRIPFPRPDEPVTQAKRKHAGARAFELVDIPRAQTLLAQAAGRLVRTADDKGVVAVLDRRLATNKNYRWKLINALPDFKRTKDQKEVTDFLKKLNTDS